MNVVLYTKDNCVFCQQAKLLLVERNITFFERILGVDFTREMILEQFPKATTFPIVVVDGFHIGGYNALKEHLEVAPATSRLLNE